MNKIINVLFIITTVISIGYTSYRLFKLSNNKSSNIEEIKEKIKFELSCEQVTVLDDNINKIWKIYCPSPETLTNFKCVKKDEIKYGAYCSYIIQKNIIKFKD